MACSRAVLIVLVAFLFASTWLYFTWRSFTKDPAKQMHQSALRTSPSAAAGNSSTPMSQTAAGNWTTATPAAMSENRDATSANFAQSRRAAVIIVGHARTLSWDIVCDNIKTRLLDALAKPPESELETYTKWHVEVFLFLSLVDADSRTAWFRLKQQYTPEMLQPCIQKLKPAYVEFMPPTYEPPKQHGCSKGNEPEYVVKGMEHKEAGFGTRIFSQCNRVDIAQDYILNVFEPKVRQQYDVFIKVRPDTIYLTDVPPLWSLNVSTITSATGGYCDFFLLAPRGCRIMQRKCTQCVDNITEPSCEGPKTCMDGAFDPRLHPVLARAYGRKFFQESRAKLLPKEQRSRKERPFGWLVVECARYYRIMKQRGATEVLRTVCESETQRFLRARPPKSPPGPPKPPVKKVVGKKTGKH